MNDTTALTQMRAALDDWQLRRMNEAEINIMSVPQSEKDAAKRLLERASITLAGAVNRYLNG